MSKTMTEQKETASVTPGFPLSFEQAKAMSLRELLH